MKTILGGNGEEKQLFLYLLPRSQCVVGVPDNVAKNWTYIKSPIKLHAVFCGMNRVADWTKGLARDLPACYKVLLLLSADLTVSLRITSYCTGQRFFWI